MDARHPVGTGRPFIKHKGFSPLTDLHTLLERTFCLPGGKDFLFESRKIELLIFAIFRLHVG